jgi:trimeric autotransporter adhesin
VDGGVIEAATIEALFSNRAPEAHDDAATAVEDGPVVTGNVLVNDTDPDDGQTLIVSNAGTYAGLYGTLVVAADGSYTYELDASLPAVQALGRNATLSEQFSYEVTDDSPTPKTAQAVLRLVIQGTNDAPIVYPAFGTAIEDGAAATGNLLQDASDIDAGDVLSVSSAGSFEGAYGTLQVNADGTYSYALRQDAAAVQRLRAGEVVQETFSYTVTDGQDSRQSALTLDVVGTNDGPLAAADGASVTEDEQPVVTGNVLANDSDPDHDTVLQVVQPGTFAGQYGTLEITADGSYTYTLSQDPAIQALGRNASVTEVFSYTVQDDASEPLTATSELTVTVQGSNDGPVTQDDVNGIAASEASVSGNVLANDSDVDEGDQLLVANAGTQAGQYGRLELTADGSYRYVVDTASAAVRGLAAGQSGVDSFAYVASDGLAQGASSLAVTVTGVNDAPILVQPLADQAARETQAFAFALPADSFVDVDQGDSLSYTAWLVDENGQTQTLPTWITFDAATRSFSGTPNFVQGGDYRLRVVASDGGGLSASGDFVLSIADSGTAPSGEITGTNGADVLNAGSGGQSLAAGNGLDLLFGGSGSDLLSGGNGFDLLFGRRGEDYLSGGTAEDWLAGGKGNDVYDTGNGRDLVAFNRGDGNDVLSSVGKGRDTISLGGGIRYQDLTLARSGDDLVLGVGQGESLTLQNWYTGTAKPVDRLQVVTVGGDYDPTSTDPTRNAQVEVFDFAKLARSYDAAARAGNAGSWSVMNSLLDAHLQGSDTAALGGDLSYQYAVAGSFSGIGLGAAQSALAAGSTEWQTLKPRSELEQGSIRLV